MCTVQEKVIVRETYGKTLIQGLDFSQKKNYIKRVDI